MFESLSIAFEILKALGGLKSQGPTAYLKKGRIEDVLDLIQVLALHENARRKESGIKLELQGDPLSGERWTQVAEEHPEFFRVSSTNQFPISLVSRYVSDPNVQKAPLTREFTQALFSTAIELHDRQIKRAERWTYLIPIWVALITGVFVIGGTMLSNRSPKVKDTVYKVEIVKPTKLPNQSDIKISHQGKAIQTDNVKISNF